MGAPCPPVHGRPVVRLEAAREIPAFLQSYFDSAPLWDGRAVRIGEGLWPLLERCWSRPEREREASPLCRALIAAPGSGWLDEHDVIEGMARGGVWPDPSRLKRSAVGAFIDAVLQDLAAHDPDGPGLRLELRFVLAPLAVQTCFAVDTLAQALREDGLDEARVSESFMTRQPDLATLEGVWCLEAGRPAGRAPRVRRSSTHGFRVLIADRAVLRLDLRLDCAPPLTGYFRRTLEGTTSARTSPGAGF